MRKVLLILLILAAVSPCLAKYSGGTGNVGDPYQIANVADLMTLASDANDYSKCFIMTADINLDPNLPGNKVFTTAVIAHDTVNSGINFEGTPFIGFFDGAGHKISNLIIDTNGAENDYLGLFGFIRDCVIKNLVLENVSITSIGFSYEAGSYYVGALAGKIYNGSIINCSSNATINAKRWSFQIGGLVGYNLNGSISYCRSASTIICNQRAEEFGGLVGKNESGDISYCSSAGIIFAGYDSAVIGGLVGNNFGGTIRYCISTNALSDSGSTGGVGGLAGGSKGIISNCYSTGNINSGDEASYIGGLLGGQSDDGVVTNSYSTGDVTVGSNSWSIGGFAGANGTFRGMNAKGDIQNCYSTGIVTGGDGTWPFGGFIGMYYSGNISSSYFIDVAGPDNGYGEPLTDLQMKQQASFTGWDFVGVWSINEGVSYPLLRWSIMNPAFSGGSGSSDDPYRISSVDDLLIMAADMNEYNKHFVLTADIDLDPNLPGNSVFSAAVIAASGTSFVGTFDGAGHKITNLTINGVANQYLGLFGRSFGEIKNLRLENISISGGGANYLGGLAGYNEGDISNCSSAGIASYGYNIGGLVGSSGIYSRIISCHFTGIITGSDGTTAVGGLAGNSYGYISNCYSAGIVTGGDGASALGGLVGWTNGSWSIVGNIINCYSSCSVTGGAGCWALGGLVGLPSGSNIINCYSTGNVTGGDGAWGLGGLVGYNDNCYISNCYSTGTVTAGDSSDGLGGLIGYSESGASGSYFLITSGPDNGLGTPLTDSQMKQQASFVGWDFVWETVNGTDDIWAICEGVSYPKLAWQFIAGDTDNDKDVNFIDFAAMGNKWMQADSNLYCGGADLTGDGWVDLEDLAAFVNNWLQ